jgi:hypothetical protein
LVGTVEQWAKYKEARAELSTAVEVSAELQYLFELAANVARGGHAGGQEQRQGYPVHQGRKNVGIDQTGQDHLPFKIHDGGIAGRRYLRATDGADALTFDDDRNTIARLVGDTVKQPGIS